MYHHHNQQPVNQRHSAKSNPNPSVRRSIRHSQRTTDSGLGNSYHEAATGSASGHLQHAHSDTELRFLTTRYRHSQSFNSHLRHLFICQIFRSAHMGPHCQQQNAAQQAPACRPAGSASSHSPPRPAHRRTRPTRRTEASVPTTPIGGGVDRATVGDKSPSVDNSRRQRPVTVDGTGEQQSRHRQSACVRGCRAQHNDTARLVWTSESPE